MTSFPIAPKRPKGTSSARASFDFFDSDAGHAGASGRYDFIKEVTSDFAFLIDKVGKK